MKYRWRRPQVNENSTSSIQENQSTGERNIEVIHMGRIRSYLKILFFQRIDKVSFLSFPVAFALFNLAYWTVHA